MKIFKTNLQYGTKTNFVDDNDVFVGYDSTQDCGEDAGYYVLDCVKYLDVEKECEDLDGFYSNCAYDVEGYYFDREFFEMRSAHVPDSDKTAHTAVFKLVSDGKPDLYLHLFNAHNGYYAHDFEVKHSGEVVKTGSL